MKVFLSWSGQRSRYLAETLRTWLPRVIQSLRPWMSDEDISPGSRWLTDISKELGDAKIGILCVTPENQSNPWLVFEAGALSKTLEQPFVCPLLFDMSPGQLKGPLAQFQALAIDRDGILRMLLNLNSALGHPSLPEKDLEETFDVWWPKLEERLSGMPKADTEVVEKRSTDDLLEEVLSITREQLRRDNLRIEAMKDSEAHFRKVIPMMEHMASQAEKVRANGAVIAELAKLQTDQPNGALPKLGELVTLAAAVRPDMFEMMLTDETTIRGMREMAQHMKIVSESNLSAMQQLLSPPPQPESDS